MWRLMVLMVLLCGSVTALVSPPADSDGLFYALRSELSEDAILVANNGIRAPFGRSVYIDPINDLVIQTQPGDRCSITVLDNDPLSQRPGHLSPKKFPCDFGPNDVVYSHFGSRSPTRDRVKLQLRYDTQTETVIIPFMMEVEVVFTQLELLTKNMPLTVDTLRGKSNSIDRRTVEFTYDRDLYKCEVTSLSGGSGLPRYGTLLDAGKLSSMMDCDEFTSAGISYAHTSERRPPNRDYVPMVVELHDLEGNPLKQEYFHLMVRIREGQENTAPNPSFVSMMMMEVGQFVMTALTSDMLAAEDAESNPDELIFNITSPLSYEEGYIVSTDDRNLPITSFYQRDLRDLKIAYKPPSLDSDTERIFQVEFEIVDTDGAISDSFAFMIVVKPMNNLAPVVTRNTGQLLYEGQSRPLFTAQNLEISDEDNLDMVTLTVVDGLKHGALLVLGSDRTFFTAADLTTGAVVYQHDGSDTYSDNIVFKMTDGKHEVEFLFPITIVPTDDEPPIINANTGLVLFKNQIMPISPLMLSAADIDSEDSTIKFTVVSPFSSIGTVLLRQSDAPEDPSSWKFNSEDEMYEKEVKEWLQKDITDGKLFYKHVGPHTTDTIMDQFLFTVQDDNDPPNQSGESVFLVRVLPIDDVPPELFPGTTLQMTVQEYKLTHFSKDVLRYTDLDSEDRDLKYTVTQPPTDMDENNPVLFGSLVLSDSPGTEVREFTQAQVNHHKVSYAPPDVELGITAHVVQFKYSVEDTSGNTVEGTFTIYLQPVNNKPPQITNTGFTVLERGSHVITAAELDASDPDTELQHITFTVSKLPQHGQIQRDFSDLGLKAVFRLEDIIQRKISYFHNGEETLADEFQVDVSDGMHVVTVTVRIGVRPIDDETPTVSLPAGTIGSHMDVLENAATEITTNVIQGHDDDTDDLQLTFIVEDPPAAGEILVKGVPANRFTQADIINGLVVYAHTGGEIGLTSQQDGFNLTLTDMSEDWTVGGNKVNGVQVRITVLPVDSQPPEVGVGEQFSVIEGEKYAIGPQHLNADDSDTPSEDILCTIVVQPKAGYVENISPAPGSEKSRSGTAISAFTIRDIRESNIYYVQSIHKGVEPVEDRFTFTCSDGVNFSENHLFPIVIIPANDEKPEIYLREIVVMEGMNIVIDTPLLNGGDMDVPAEELVFTVSKPPKHGAILNQLSTGSVPVTNFTLEQIREASSIIYEHDDSETTEDSFEVVLSDGKYSVHKTAVVMIVSVDDETPRMLINDGLEVEVGETKGIGSNVLKATDLDSDDSSLTYIVRFGPGQGLLQRRTPSGSLQNITVGMNFTQENIDAGLISYTHNGQEGIRDLVKFDVTDGMNPLIDRYFYVTIGSIDMVFPDVVSKGVSLKEGGRVTLTTNLLSTTDMNSPDENLVFTVTRAPVRGHLECTDRPGVPIASFTQLQLAGSKVYYIHTSDDEIKMDSFEFEVTDGYNPIFRTFRISIVDVDNKKPVVTINVLLVSEGQSKLITPFELTAEDQDTPEKKLKFTITQLPVHGKLLYNQSSPVASFTKQDLNENLISYKHDGTESSQDSFSFTITDGTHTDFYVFPDTVFETRKPQTMRITIVGLDNGAPQIVVNKGATALKILPTGRLGFPLSPKVLKAVDRDSAPESLLFRITLQPKHGDIINTRQGNNSIATFSQELRRERARHGERGRDTAREGEGRRERVRHGERGRDTARGGERGQDTAREGETRRERARGGERGRERVRHGERGRERARHGEGQRDTAREGEGRRGAAREGERGRERVRHGERGRERVRHGERGRERAREGGERAREGERGRREGERGRREGRERAARGRREGERGRREGERGQERAREGERGQERAREGERGQERARGRREGSERAREGEQEGERGRREGERGRERAREGKRGRERAREGERPARGQREGERGRQEGERGRREGERGRERAREGKRGREAGERAARGRERAARGQREGERGRQEGERGRREGERGREMAARGRERAREGERGRREGERGRERAREGGGSGVNLSRSSSNHNRGQSRS
uniref:FRAS1-related extracellular matrix protein N-terminal domain-containing protein n=1 Tax=Knipowitschia caucasica TaxID=637954 RepID=A0AAV2JC33_KNICA